jgi:hypothetical protein
VTKDVYEIAKDTIYPVPYMKDTIVEMLKWYDLNILNKVF